MTPRYVLFDAVGTLIYPKPSVAAAYEAVGKAHGIELAQSEILVRFRTAYGRIFGRAAEMPTDETRERARWRQVVAEVFAEFPRQIDSLLAALWQHFAEAEHWLLFDDVAETWQALSARGYALGIASNFDARLRGVVQGHPSLAGCSHVFVSTELNYAKPDPRFFLEIERRLAVPAEQLLMVGDDYENDVVAPRSRGWHALALNRNEMSADGLRNLFELVNRLP